MRALAPCEISDSTSVSCFAAEDCASAEIYLAPWASSAFLIAASSVFQRSSWKFDQETPTVRSFAIAAKETTLADASKAAPIAEFFNDFMYFLPNARQLRKNALLQAKPDHLRNRHHAEGR